MTTTFSTWLFVFFGMLLMDTILCAWFLRKFSESLLEFTITALIFIIAKLLEQNPIKELDSIIFTSIAAGAVAISLCVMFYHLFGKILPASPYRKKKHHGQQKNQPPHTPAKKDRDNH